MIIVFFYIFVSISDDTTLIDGDVTVFLFSFSGEGKAKEMDTKCTVFKRAVDQNYGLKMKSSRALYSEIVKRFGTLAFSITYVSIFSHISHSFLLIGFQSFNLHKSSSHYITLNDTVCVFEKNSIK
jgi:hypothetical protein